MAGSSGSQTQRTEPPKYQLPFLQHGTEQARQLYDWQQQDPSRIVAGQNGSTIDALRRTADMARDGNGITGAAGSLAQQTLNGDFLNANPYLDQTFNRAALATQNQLASQFAGAGRNIGASEGLRSQQLNDLATQIYGGNYANERAIQQQTLGMSPGLAQGQYADLDRLLGVGQLQEGYAQQQLDARGTALDDYMRRVSGNMGSTVKTSGGGNQAAGALGGAMAGAQMGSIFGPWGAGIGGVLGGIGGLL
jgi:hypothetical protein